MAQQQKPLYEQIADDLRGQIDTGDLTENTRLPTELELSRTYEASRNTIRDAIRRLISQGLVETRHGQGTFVKKKIDPFVTRLTTDPKTGFGGGEGAAYLSQVAGEHRSPRSTTPKIEVQTPPDVITKRLRVASDAQVVSRHQERFIDDIPWSLQTSFYPWEYITKGATELLMAQDIKPGAVEYLAEKIGVRQVGYRDWITARLPDDNEQKFFGIAHDATVFVIFRTAFDQDQKPMRLTVTVFPADRNQFIVDVGVDLPDPQYDEEPGATA
jgi:GntR family transcriptional regulator